MWANSTIFEGKTQHFSARQIVYMGRNHGNAVGSGRVCGWPKKHIPLLKSFRVLFVLNAVLSKDVGCLDVVFWVIPRFLDLSGDTPIPSYGVTKY